jgi:APA family basic amino acid/polyamine antiporter
MQWITAIKLGALGLIIVLALALRTGDWSNFVPLVAQRAGADPLPGALAPALVGAFFAFGGWWEINKLAGEVRDPARTLPRALLLGVSAVTAVYVLTSAVFLYLVPLTRVTSGETFAAQAGAALFGPAGGRVFAGIVIVAVLGSLLALLMALPRVYYALARDGLFFRGVAAVHPRFGTPARAIAIQAGLASLLVALGTFNQILAYFIFITVLFVGLTVAGLFRLRRAEPEGPAYQAPGYPMTPLIFLALVALLLVLLAGHNPAQAALGAGVVVLGLPVYDLLFRRKEETPHDLDSYDPTG